MYLTIPRKLRFSCTYKYQDQGNNGKKKKKLYSFRGGKLILFKQSMLSFTKF